MMRRVGAAVVMLVVLHLMAATPVSACWCLPSHMATVSWPEDGALDVAQDSAIVVWRHYRANDRSGLSVTLTGPGGEELEIEEVRYSREWWQCSGETVFFQPKQPLVEGLSYAVTTRADGEPEPLHAITFTVADGANERRAELEPEVTYLSVRADASHEYCYAHCLDMAEIRVDMGEVPETPVWVFVRSEAAPYQNNIWTFWSKLIQEVAEGEPDPRRIRQISVHATVDNPCVEIGIYGVDGRPLLEERRCQPDRCVVYGLRSTNLCNHPPVSGVDASRISDRSCDDPPKLREDDKYQIIYPAIDAGAAPKRRRVHERLPDCSVSQPTAAGGVLWPVVLLLLAGAFLRRRCQSFHSCAAPRASSTWAK